MTKKEELVEAAEKLGIDTTDLTIPQLEAAISDATPEEEEAEGLEVKDAETVEPVIAAEEDSAKVYEGDIDIAPLVSEEAIQSIASCANGKPDSKEKLEAIVRACVVVE